MHLKNLLWSRCPSATSAQHCVCGSSPATQRIEVLLSQLGLCYAGQRNSCEIEHAPSSLAHQTPTQGTALSRWLQYTAVLRLTERSAAARQPDIAAARLRHCLGPMAELSNIWSDTPGTIRLLVVGDVHYKWDSLDRRALDYAAAHAVIFLGDFGEEALDIVQDIAALPHPKAVILGNHDAWHALYGGSNPDFTGTQTQLKLLGSDHLAWSAKRFANPGHPPFSVVGARPFSQGGTWEEVSGFYSTATGVGCMQESAARIAACIQAQPKDEPVIVIAHNGPHGLGATPEAPAGKDFTRDQHGEVERADYGDRDLQQGLDGAAGQGDVCAVLFGHMHHRLHPFAGGGLRNMAALKPNTATAYLNAAVVPRVVQMTTDQGQSISGRHFLAVEIHSGGVISAQNVWLHVPQAAADEPSVMQTEALLRTDSSTRTSITRSVFRAHSQDWSECVTSVLPL